MADFAIVEKAGPLTLIQDTGRRGQQHLGVSVGGALDTHAAGWANLLLDNTASAALLEICLGPFALRFPSATRIAITGADCGWQLDGEALQPWSSHRVPAGGLLQAGMARDGLRGYLAVAGGFKCPPVWGSRATTVGERLGGLNGLNGEPLKNADRLPYGQDSGGGLRQAPAEFQRRYDAPLALRLVPSNQYADFSESARRQFFGQEYKVAPDSDRMGVRLSGEALEEVPGNLVSEAVCPGVVQVPASGQPIVLMRDCQTIGGYPKLGHVYSVDLDWLAQARPGARVRFMPGSLAESQALLREQRQFFIGANDDR
ncbi:biotin-dependent carboxyltransferase family protein [Microbulbifer guangxiensis]|uniref:5-oxoprolinase subunit C family protein n=1 Tax=Microbulbifer guangxiensis TaxID=2904249 RepID=UPI001F2E3F29|nr:biotin-dependent carboxyltransferase family protein [Microbulbifer guangxiensis]